MILHGILDQALNRYCIRGFAKVSELAAISQADNSYQRKWQRQQTERMAEYLNGNDSFFPEVILSFTLPLDLVVGERTDEFSRYQQPSPFPATRVATADGNIKFQVKRAAMPARNVPAGRPETHLQTVSIDLDDDFVRQLRENGTPRPFFRIDGNHRLNVADALDPTAAESIASEKQIPFSLLIFSADSAENTKMLERQFFNDINSKGLPLTLEERLRVVVDRPDDKEKEAAISDTELHNPARFGPAYLLTRYTLPLLRRAEFPALRHLLHVSRDGLGRLRSLCFQVYEMLLQLRKSDPDSASAAEGIDADFQEHRRFLRALLDVDALYAEEPRLEVSKAPGLLFAFVYYAFRGDRYRLLRFRDWALQNYLQEQHKVKARDVVRIFDAIIRGRSRRIFISMPFNADCKPHSDMIKTVVDEINQQSKHPNFQIKPLRVDEIIRGTTHKISDTIIDEISQSGLLIADLTGSNPNVYHEVGYLMGIAQHMRPAPNLLLLLNERITPIATVGFNLRDYHLLTFKDSSELREKLKKQIEACYTEAGTPTRIKKEVVATSSTLSIAKDSKTQKAEKEPAADA